jgi:ABC-type Fe3+-hydroxamate transport system substrate-binding protein
MIITKEKLKTLNIRYKRIISLVPSVTETLFYLGLSENIVGITKWCKHPANEVIKKAKIGGVIGIDIEKINKLKPDLVFAVKEENDKDEIDELAKFTNVYVGEINNLSDAYNQIIDIGRLTGVIEKSERLVDDIKADFSVLSIFNNKTCAYLVWNKPLMLVGGNTFINNVLENCGLINVFNDRISYPVVTIDEINEKNPDIIFLCSEPFEFKEKHKMDFEKDFPNKKVLLVDGEIFTWYGSHLLKTKEYCRNLEKML